MNIKRKRILSFIIAFSMILSSFNFNLFNSKEVHAKEMTSVETTVSVSEAIESVIACMNKDYYDKKGGSLEGEAYAAMFRAGANIGQKSWSVNKDTSTYGLVAFGSKVTQALALMDLDEDPTTYKNINLISDITQEISKVSSPKDIGINEVKALILLDRYNEKFSDKKVNYNAENVIKNLIASQKEDGSINNAPQHTSAALVVLNKHKDIHGANECIEKALDYLYGKYTENGSLVNKKFFTGPNAEAVMWFAQSGENLIADKWIKDGKGIIETLFNLWDGKKFVNSSGSTDFAPIPKVLYALVSLKKAGYGDYQIKGVKFNNVKKEELEKICEVNVAIVLPENGKYVSYFKPQEVTISNKEHDKGLTALGALQASTKMYQMSKNMVTSIFGYENKGSNGWMYTVNGIVPDIMAGDYEVKAGDKIIWYYSMNGMEGKAPTWEELTGEKTKEDEEKKIIKVNLAIEGYKGLILDAKDIKAKESETVAEIFERVLNEKKIEYINKDGYISMIGGQEEKDRGTYSGWKYSVNGKFPNIGVAGYNPKKGDNIRFIFVKGFMDEVPYIDINNIKLDTTSLNLKVGETTKLNVTITPENATDKKIIWTSNDETIVSVDEKGNIKALKEGKAIIKASTEKIGKLEAKATECEITVKAKDEPVAQKDGSNINTIIDGVIDYYNNEHFITNQSQLVGYEYSAMYRAGADLSKKQWHLNEKFEPSFDKQLKYIGNMADQSLILIDLCKDPNNYDGRHFIDEILEKIDGSNSYFGQREIKGVIALDKYNEKFSDKKVNYNEKHAIEKILEAQCEDGGFKERKSSTIINTGYALMALSKHKGIEGVDKAISKALTYLRDAQKDDGGFYDKSFITGNHVEAIRGLIAVGENPTSKEWTKSSGKNLVDALFTLWKDNNAFDAQKGESINNRGWEEATWKALYALVDLKEAGYGEYLVDGVKVKGLNDVEDDKEEKTCKVNVAIALPENGEYVSYFKPQEATISDKKHKAGFTALGALQAATTLYEISGKMVTSIYGYENKGLNGWMYSVNGVVPDIMAEDFSIKAGDKIIWYYSIGGMDGKKPTWDELIGEKSKEDNEEPKPEKKIIEIENLTTKKEFKLGSDAKVTIKATNKTKENKDAALIVGVFNKDGQLVNYGAVEQNIKADEDVKLTVNLSLQKEGEYTVKAFVWDSLDKMNSISKVIEIPVK
ncbi:hypothetical protein DP130_11305 [Clostridium tetani]|uniref:BIG2 domain-containing protein n=1 Tax=Clostridium tetani TaxID=1513 RepID=A0A4Q0VC01_CLOTA|nr:DUF4430 domain-containing protein [Clostridium tetani]RXI46144.1 hypothetical protein DP130_11305 [Clostridium tetani]